MPDAKHVQLTVVEFIHVIRQPHFAVLAAASLQHSLTRNMKHSAWLRLQEQAERICSVLRQKGYRCLKRHQRLSWCITKEGQGVEYSLSWIPAPAGEWVVLPNNADCSIRQDILKSVDIALAARLNNSQVSPWTLVRLLPNAQRYTVARFFNRQDAEDHKRTLHRFMPAAEFEVVFEAPVDDYFTSLEVKS